MMFGADVALIAGYTAAMAAAVGGGVSAYSSYQQGKATESATRYNYMLQMRQAEAARTQARYQQEAMYAQSRLMREEAAANFGMAMSEAQARLSNAVMIRQQAEAQASNDRENMRKERLQMERLSAIQRARVAGSGVVESGSPLEALAESAGEMMMALNEMHYQSNINRTVGMREADLEEFGGKLQQAGANASLAIANASAGLNDYAAKAERMKAASAYKAAVFSANINRRSGMDMAKAYRTQAVGQGIGAVSSLLGGISTTSYNSAKATGNLSGGGSSVPSSLG